MTERRDFNRLARAWLDLMPDEAPDRVIAAVLEATEQVRQVRGPLAPNGLRIRANTVWAIPERWLHPMNRLTYAAVALVIVVLGGGALLLAQNKQPPVGPSVAPTPTASITAQATADFVPIPATLYGNWFGGSRTLAGLLPDAGTVLNLAPTAYKVEQSNQQDTILLGGGMSLVDGRIKVEKATGPSLNCGSAVASYAYSLSASRETLTISDAEDPCSVRQSTLTGTWWRIDCKIGQSTCIGLMDPGTYKSQYVRPMLRGAKWSPRFGGVTLTVPEGWANFADWPNEFGLNQSATYQGAETGEGAPSIDVFTQVVASAQGASRCSDKAAPGVVTTSTATIGFLRSVPGLTVSAAHQLTIDGHPATWVDIGYDDATVKPCPDSGDRLVKYLSSGDACCAVDAGRRVRDIFVELGSSDLLAISVVAADQRALDAFWTDALPIITSFQFE